MFILSNSGRIAYGIQEILVDSYAELAQVNITNYQIGSQAYATEEQQWYILDSKKRWVPFIKQSGGGGGGSGPAPEYDGGNLNPGGDSFEDGNGPTYDGGNMNPGGDNAGRKFFNPTRR